MNMLWFVIRWVGQSSSWQSSTTPIRICLNHVLVMTKQAILFFLSLVHRYDRGSLGFRFMKSRSLLIE